MINKIDSEDNMRMNRLVELKIITGTPSTPEHEPFPDDDPVPPRRHVPEPSEPDEPETVPPQPVPDTGQPVMNVSSLS